MKQGRPITWKDRAKFAWRILVKSSAIAPYIARLYGNRAVWTGGDYTSLVQAGFVRCGDVYSCITTILIAGRQLRIGLYQGTEDDNEELTGSNFPLAQLMRRPNPSQSLGDLLEYTVGYLLCGGNCFLEAVRPFTSRPPNELYTHRPDLIQIYFTNNATSSPTLIDHYGLIGTQIRWSPEDMGHAKLFNPLEPWYGMSPLRAAAYGIDTINESKHVQKSLLQNSGRPPGILQAKADLTPEQQDQLKRDLRDEYMGSAAAGTPMVVSGDFSWLGQAFSPEQMQALELRGLEKRDIAAILHVPPELVGDTQNKTYSNYQEARKGLYTEAVLPLWDLVCGFLTLWLCPQFGENLFLAVDRDSVDALQEDREKTWNRVFGAVDRGLIDRDEGRLELGYAKRTEKIAGQLTVGAGTVLLEELALPPDQPPMEGAPPPQLLNGKPVAAVQ
jgi:HK97 family phage portal protein